MFFLIFGFFSKVLRLLLNVMEVTIEHQKCPKISTNRGKRSFFAGRAKKASDKGQSPPQELEVSPRSRLYFLVNYNGKKDKISLRSRSESSYRSRKRQEQEHNVRTSS